MAELLGLNETYAGRRLAIPPEGGVFGRDPRNHVVLTHESISSLHGIFRVEAGALYARDQQSTNGTRLHGRDITEVQIQDGDELEIGNLLFRVVAPEFARRPDAPNASPAPAPAPVSALASASTTAAAVTLPSPASTPAPAAPPVARQEEEIGFLQRPSALHTLAGVVAILVVVILAALVLSGLGD
jgi:predicted component of type VI protein secretion system